MTSRAKLILLGVFGVLFSVTFALLTIREGIASSCIYSAVVVVAIILTKPGWASASYNKSKTATALVGAASAFPFALAYKPLLARDLLGGVLPAQFAGSPHLFGYVATLYFLTLGFLGWLTRDKSIGAKHPSSVARDVPSATIGQELASFKKSLAVLLNHEDVNSRWNEHFYEPLEAEIEVRGKKKRLPKLLDALRDNNVARTTVLIGEPGSGKSVALRNVALSILSESERSGRIPLYVNLRGWDTRSTGGATSTSLLEYVKHYIEEQTGDLLVKQFLDRHFLELYKSGHIFFILDSFDEAPAILDADDSTEAVVAASKAIAMLASNAKDGRLIVASRIHRQPLLSESSAVRITLLPFSVRQAFNAMVRAIPIQEQRIRRLFRYEAIAASCRNPFLAGLLRSYILSGETKDPATRLELYDAFIRQRVAVGKEWLQTKSLTADEVWSAAANIAWEIYRDQTSGLDIDPNSVQFLDRPSDAIEALVYLRLLRHERSTIRTVAFVHRRFAEFFAAQYLRRRPAEVRPEGIPTDSRWRDMLVLYCEIATESELSALAEFSVNVLRNSISGMNADSRRQFASSSHAETRRLFSTLRFITEAFSSRRVLLASQAKEIAQSIQLLMAQENPLFRKLAIEAAPLLDDEGIATLVAAGLQGDDITFSLDALYQYRRITAPSVQIRNTVLGWMCRQPILALWQLKDDLLFIFDTCEDIRSRRFFFWHRVDSFSVLGAVFFLFAQMAAKMGATGQFSLALAMAFVAFLLDLCPWSWQAVLRLWFVISAVIGGTATHHLVLVVLAFPVIPLVVIPWRSALRGSGRFIFSIAFPIVIGVVTRLSNYVFGQIGGYVVNCAMYLFGAYGIVTLVRVGFEYRRVGRMLIAETRQTVEQDLRSLKYVAAQDRYIRRLASSGIVLTGEWSSPRVAVLRTPSVSTALAKLDAAWLGLTP